MGRGSDVPNLVAMELNEVAQLLQALNEPAYRAEQLLDWIYKKAVYSFDQMTNLPKELRETLKKHVGIRLPEAVKVQIATDGTRKYLLELSDKNRIEAVSITEGNRITACLSSQVGCAIGCSFCATGRCGHIRNLTVDEIVGQLLLLQQEQGVKFTNIVMMGMGEPLANYSNLIRAIRVMNHPQALDIGARRFTVSTAGVIPGIRRLMTEDLQINLAISLHAPNDDLRDELVPLNRRYPIGGLIKVCREYIQHTGRRVTFEYVLLRNVNDSADQADQLGQLLERLLCHVNLIPVNVVQGTQYEQPDAPTIMSFASIVQKYGVSVSVRKEKGADIDAACGQLRLRDEVKAF